VDIQLYLRVLWRFRVLVVIGLLLATSLAFLSIVNISFDGGLKFSYRETPPWRSEATLLVTQGGFPEGRSIFDEAATSPDITENTYISRFADPSRFERLALLYAHFATSDEVRQRMRRDGPLNGRIDAEAVPAPDGGSLLPIITVTATSPTPAAAKSLANRTVNAFREFLQEQQQASRIDAEDRVELPVINRPDRAEQVGGQPLLRPAFVFLLVFMISVALAFILENLRPRIRQVPRDQPLAGLTRDVSRRSA
jgi:hypothetical protein